jgi:hypothetical protein
VKTSPEIFCISVAAPSGDRKVRRDGMGRERVLAPWCRGSRC